MKRKYIVIPFTDVLSVEFIGMCEVLDTPQEKAQQYMNRIEEYEANNDLDFIMFLGKESIIFKQVI